MTRALVGGIGTVMALYLFANVGYVAALGMAGLAASDAPAVDVMRLALGPPGAVLMATLVTGAAIGVLNALVIVGGRTLYAAAEDVPALARLARWDDARGVPRAAVLVQTAGALALVAWAGQGTGFAQVVGWLSPVFWLFLALSGLAWITLRRTRPELHRPFRTPLGHAPAIVFTAGSLWMLVSSLLFVGWAGAALSGAVMGAGALLLLVLRR